MKVAIVLGTRPEIIKNYSIVKALKGTVNTFYVLHTNQHYDHNLQGAIFEQVGYSPDFVLPGEYTIGKAVDWVGGLIRQLKIDLIIVNGDTSAALVGAIAAVYNDVKIAHIEAGLRSFDKEMYEERNRIMVDACAHYLFTYTSFQKEYLDNILELRGDIFNVGNTTVDFLADFSHLFLRPSFHYEDTRYAYVTLHRKEFTDFPDVMRQVFSVLNDLVGSRVDRVIFPMHPRTRHAIELNGISFEILDKVDIVDPVPPMASLSYAKHAKLIITDSGCLQEEAYLLGTPCVTVRENTERPETIVAGANIVSGFDIDAIYRAVDCQLGQQHCQWPKVYGEYGVGERIVKILSNEFNQWPRKKFHVISQAEIEVDLQSP